MRLGTGELNALNTTIGPGNISTTATVDCLNLIATGAQIDQRVGRKIDLESVYIRGFVRADSSQTTGQVVRLMLVWDKNPNGQASTAAITDILDSAHTNAHLNLSNRDRFDVLWDKIMYVAKITDGAGTSGYTFKKYKRLGRTAVYGNTTAEIGSVYTGALLFVTVGNVALGTNTNPEYSFTSRIRYKP